LALAWHGALVQNARAKSRIRQNNGAHSRSKG
jgi:hypothetical protein